jgi:hypothetical protein
MISRGDQYYGGERHQIKPQVFEKVGLFNEFPGLRESFYFLYLSMFSVNGRFKGMNTII